MGPIAARAGDALSRLELDVRRCHDHERYQTAPDGVFGHGFMYWQPLQYGADGLPQPLNWTDGFSLDL